MLFSSGLLYTQWAMWRSFFRSKPSLSLLSRKNGANHDCICMIKDRTRTKHLRAKYSTDADADATAHCFLIWQWVSLLYTDWVDKWAFTKADDLFTAFFALSHRLRLHSCKRYYIEKYTILFSQAIFIFIFFFAFEMRLLLLLLLLFIYGKHVYTWTCNYSNCRNALHVLYI